MMNSRANAIEKKLTQRPLDSKKALYALLAGVCVLITFGASAFLILTHAEVAKEIVELANLVVLFFGATVTTLITGQACMDWKAMSALQHLSEDRTEETRIESNQTLPELQNLDNSKEVQRDIPLGETEVYVSGRRSPKDFLDPSLKL